MYKTDNEIWEAVMKLKGKTVKTISQNNPNRIQNVEDTGSENDAVIILNRKTKPNKADIINAYKKFYSKGRLERKKDLQDLAHISKQVSSIVFAVIYEIAMEDIELVQEGRVIHFELKKSHISARR